MNIKDSIDKIRQQVPSLFISLNVAQYRALEEAYRPHKEWGDLPAAFSILSMANGVGKTTLMVLDQIGWCMGREFLNWREFPPCAIEFYDSLGPLRDSGQMTMRLTCAADDMKAGGSVHDCIKEIWPWAKLGGIDSGRCYRQIEAQHPRIKEIKNTIAVKTFDQDSIKHEGSNCRRVWVNEPLPADLLGATIGRIRTKKGAVEGSIFMTGTLLEGSEWVDEIEDDKHLRIINARGHIYENCVGDQVTDEMANEVLVAVGHQLQKNPAGKGYVTHGVLTRSSIMAQISLWQKTCPNQLEARKSGAKMSSAGKVFQTFRNEQPQVIPSETYPRIPQNWPVLQIVDPHSAKDDFSLWMAVTPMNRVIFLAEWPTVQEVGPYESVDGRRYTIQSTCEQWRRVEAELGISRQIIRRVGDPNRMEEPNPRNGETLKWDYEKYGFSFDTNISDNIELGERRIHEFLWFDELRYHNNPMDTAFWPRMMVMDRCVNAIQHIRMYSRKRVKDPSKGLSERTEQKYACVVACIRYGIMAYEPFDDLKLEKDGDTDYNKIKQGRLPQVHRVAQDQVRIPPGHRIISGNIIGRK